MKLVINIPGEIRKSILDGVYCGIIDKRVSDAIRDGVSLPEGYSDLIDRDALIEVADADYEDGEFHAVSVREIEYADAVIPADMSE